jgi:hypothetical protein
MRFLLLLLLRRFVLCYNHGDVVVDVVVDAVTESL